MTSFVPRYYEIEQALRARIAVLDPGDVLPSDSALCEEFGVSRMTARQAVQVLTQEGLVERIRGRGTFVAEPSTHRQAGNLLSFTTEMRRQNRVPSSRVLERRVRPATSDEIVAATGRYYRHAIECFGVERSMFESNFPVDRQSCSYHVLWNAFKKLVADGSANEKRWLFHDAAATAYRLSL